MRDALGPQRGDDTARSAGGVVRIGCAAGLDTRRGAPLDGLRPVLAELARIGFSHAELSAPSLGVIVDGRLQPTRLGALRDALAERALGLTVHASRRSSALLGNLFDTTTPAQEESAAADLELAGAIGAEVLVYHSGLLRAPLGDDRAVARGLAAERDGLRALGDRAGRLGVRIALENVDPVLGYVARRAYGLRIDAVAEQVEAVNHPCVGLCLDVGHGFLAARYLGYDFLAAVRGAADLITHVHLSDNFGRAELDDGAMPDESLILGEGDLHLPPGWGAAPLDDVFAVPFPRQPIVVLEVRPQFAPHLPEALATTHRLLDRGARTGAADRSAVPGHRA